MMLTPGGKAVGDVDVLDLVAEVLQRPPMRLDRRLISGSRLGGGAAVGDVEGEPDPQAARVPSGGRGERRARRGRRAMQVAVRRCR